MKGHVRVVASLAITAFFLWLALHDVSWPQVWTHLRRANWPLFLLAILVSTLGIHIRALRWKTLLAPVDPHVAFRPRMAGAAVGFAANNLIPARVGEFARALVCARLGRLPVSAVFASLVVERVLDALVTVGLLFGAMAWPGFPPADSPGTAAALATARVVALLGTIGAIGLLGMALVPRRAVALAEWAARILPHRFRRRAVEMLEAFLGGLGVLRSPRLLMLSVAWAVGQWMFLAISYELALRAFGIGEPGYVGSVFLQSITAFASAIPASPGFFGTFEAAVVLGLGLWGVDRSRAASFSIGFHLGGFLSVTALGLWYVWRLGLSWGELTHSGEKMESRVDASSAGRPAAAASRSAGSTSGR